MFEYKWETLGSTDWQLVRYLDGERDVPVAKLVKVDLGASPIKLYTVCIPQQRYESELKHELYQAKYIAELQLGVSHVRS